MAFDSGTSDAMVSPVVTHFHLLRHGHTNTGGKRLSYGWTDLALSEQGQLESQALFDIATQQLPQADGIISSDRIRCSQLAKRLAEELSLPLIISAELREQHMGDWEARAWSDLQQQYGTAINDYWDNYLEEKPPGGESYQNMGLRLEKWWKNNIKGLEGKRWLFVGHIGIIRALLCQQLGLPLSEALRFAPAHGTHTHLITAEAGAVIQVLGERSRSSEAETEAEQYRTRAVKAHQAQRIALSGSAGVGKTTLGTALAKELNIPFIKEGMRTRLENGFNFHGMSRLEHRALLIELWEEQKQWEKEAFQKHGAYVADRSSLDFAAFWLAFQFTDDMEASEKFLGEALSHAKQYDAVFTLPWGAIPLEHDGIRSTNQWYQRHFQATVEGLTRREIEPGRCFFLPGLTHFDQRLQWVLGRLT